MQHQLLKFTAEEFTHKKGLDFKTITIAKEIAMDLNDVFLRTN